MESREKLLNNTLLEASGSNLKRKKWQFMLAPAQDISLYFFLNQNRK